MAQDRERTEPESRGRHDLFPPRLPEDLKGFLGFSRHCTEHREAFWQAQAGRISWDQPFTEVVRENFAEGRAVWFTDGKLNAGRVVLDRPGGEGKPKPGILFLDGTGGVRAYDHLEVDREVRRIAAALAAKGLKPGDRAALYLPDSPETVFFLLACASLGIISVPIPTRYTAELTHEILADSGSALLVVAFGAGSQSYEARAQSVVESAGGLPVVNAGSRPSEGTIPLSEFASSDPASLESFPSLNAEHPFFILYANSAAGVPRGSVFATAGFLVQAAASYDYLFGSSTDGGEVKSMVCTLDLATAAGMAYGLWGPLVCGACIVISSEGMQTAGDRLRLVLERCEAPALLATPVMLSALMRELGDTPLSAERSFRLVASSGDVLKPRHIQFAARTLVSSPEKALNLWVQTECGAALIATFPSPELNRPGALGLPFPGVEPVVLNYLGQACRANESGQLVFRTSWPAMVRAIWGQEERYRQLYFRRTPGYYSTNDGARLDGEGFFWFMGRIDDVVKVRGQSLATSEIEAVLVAHPRVAEAAVVSVEGEEGEDTLVAFLVPEHPFDGDGRSEELRRLEEELFSSVERRVGEFAPITQFIIAPELPRTRTGKIVRRVLKRIATGDIAMDEDLSHLANPNSVEKLIRERGM